MKYKEIGVKAMKWNAEDISLFIQAQEYVDTIIFPLYPVSFGNDINQCASMTEFISLITVHLERQFKGRLLLLPGFPYLSENELDKHLADIQIWERELIKKGFKHIIYVTSDSKWKAFESELEGLLLWIPSLPLADMEEKYKNSIIEDQVKQLIQLFIRKWR